MSAAIPSKFDREHIRSIQMALNEKMGARLKVDGDFGAQSVSVLISFQFQNELVVTGAYDLATQALLEPMIQFKYLNMEDYRYAAKALGVSIPAIRTVVHVEAGGDGFLNNGKCDILFERHKFDMYLAKTKSIAEMSKLRAQFPELINVVRGGYIGGSAEWKRYNQAYMIGKKEAMLSTSWGMFQIMGFNYALAGYQSVETFVDAMCQSERQQLLAFVAFIRANRSLHNALIAGNWPEFARLYNGAAYKDNQYDVKLAAAFKVFTTDYQLA